MQCRFDAENLGDAHRMMKHSSKDSIFAIARKI